MKKHIIDDDVGGGEVYTADDNDDVGGEVYTAAADNDVVQ